MDNKALQELTTVLGQCNAKLESLKIELLAQIAVNTTAILKHLAESNHPKQMEFDFSKKEQEEQKPAAVETQKDEVQPVVKKTKAKIVAPKPAASAAVSAPEVTQTKTLSKDEVTLKLTDFIVDHPEGEVKGEAEVLKALKALGNYSQLPELPAEKYGDLLESLGIAA